MLEELMKRAIEAFRDYEKVREEAVSKSNKARILSKQGILLTHKNDLSKAARMIVEAKRLLGEISSLDAEFEMNGLGEIQSAWEEYAEAAIFYHLKSSSNYPSPEEIGASFKIYLLALGDVVGELRRSVLDSLRVGEYAEAESKFKLMEEIYLNLVSMEEAQLLLKGLRRKIDVARSVIENTRGELTAEIGRERLGEHIRQLSRNLTRMSWKETPSNLEL